MKVKEWLQKIGNFIIDNKIILYALIVVFLITSAVFYFNNKESGLAQNFLVGSIELFVTIVFVDILINISRSGTRNKKLKEINKHTSQELKFLTAHAVYTLGSDLGYAFSKDEKTLEIFEYPNEKLRDLSEKILISDSTKKTLAKSENSINHAKKFFKKQSKYIEGRYESFSKLLEAFKPYADPSAVDKLKSEAMEIRTHLYVLSDIADILLKVKKESNDPKGFKLALKVVWIPTFRGEVHGAQKEVLNIFKRYSEMLLYLHDRAEKNNLYFEVEN